MLPKFYTEPARALAHLKTFLCPSYLPLSFSSLSYDLPSGRIFFTRVHWSAHSRIYNLLV